MNPTTIFEYLPPEVRVGLLASLGGLLHVYGSTASDRAARIAFSVLSFTGVFGVGYYTCLLTLTQ